MHKGKIEGKGLQRKSSVKKFVAIFNITSIVCCVSLLYSGNSAGYFIKKHFIISKPDNLCVV